MQEFEDLEEDLSNLGDDCKQPHLTKEDYEKSLNIEQSSSADNNLNNVDDIAYQGMADTVMAKLQHKYNLRPKNKPMSTAQPKKILRRGETYELIQKDTETQNNKGVDSKNINVKESETQVRRTNIVETRTPEMPITAKEKVVQTNKMDRKESEVSAKEMDTIAGSFCLENEINKIKIPIPLVELAKNPMYRKKITKMINFLNLES
jgi:hypothetical protein